MLDWVMCLNIDRLQLWTCQLTTWDRFWY
jgi:hypothetical protein